MRSSDRKIFTLIEVVIALAILALSVTGLLQLMISGQKRAARAMEQWDNMHRAAQAAEYLMLFDADTDSVPDTFFPYQDCHLNIKYIETEDLPEDLNNLDGQLALHTLSIELIRNQDYKTLETILIDRIEYDTSETGSQDR